MGDLVGLAPRRRLPCRRAVGAAVWYERGVEREAAGDRAGALAAYRRALAADRRHADAHCNLGRLLHDAGDHVAAEGHFRLATCAAPDLAVYWYNLGVAVEDGGRRAEAIACYRAAVERDPDLADAHFNLARLLERAGDAASVREALRHLTIYRALRRAG